MVGLVRRFFRACAYRRAQPVIRIAQSVMERAYVEMTREVVFYFVCRQHTGLVEVIKDACRLLRCKLRGTVGECVD